ETLEGRIALSTALPDVAVLSATQRDAGHVVVTYQVRNAPVSRAMNLAIDRSATASVGATTIQVASSTLTGSSLTIGTHSVLVTVPNSLGIDPAHPFVIAVANPGRGIAESNYANATASYRTRTIGVVPHGFYPGLSAPAWIGEAASGLRADGYDQAIAFDWAVTSAIPVSGQAVAA